MTVRLAITLVIFAISSSVCIGFIVHWLQERATAYHARTNPPTAWMSVAWPEPTHRPPHELAAIRARNAIALDRTLQLKAVAA